MGRIRLDGMPDRRYKNSGGCMVVILAVAASLLLAAFALI